MPIIKHFKKICIITINKYQFPIVKKKTIYRLVIFICPILILVFGLNSIYYYIIILPRSDFTRWETLLLLNLTAFIYNLPPCHITTTVSALRQTNEATSIWQPLLNSQMLKEWYRDPSTSIHIDKLACTSNTNVPCRGQWITFLPCQGITGNLAQHTKDSKHILPLIWKPQG